MEIGLEFYTKLQMSKALLKKIPPSQKDQSCGDGKGENSRKRKYEID
jgi:hypothetical protein